VVQDRKVTNLIETTSLTANKVAQERKEVRIRNNGGTYIKLLVKRGYCIQFKIF